MVFDAIKLTNCVAGARTAVQESGKAERVRGAGEVLGVTVLVILVVQEAAVASRIAPEESVDWIANGGEEEWEVHLTPITNAVGRLLVGVLHLSSHYLMLQLEDFVPYWTETFPELGHPDTLMAEAEVDSEPDGDVRGDAEVTIMHPFESEPTPRYRQPIPTRYSSQLRVR